MTCWVGVHRIDCARGKVVCVYMDVANPGVDRWGVAVFYEKDGVAARLGQSFGMDRETAFDMAEENSLLPGPEGDCGWRAVLARCQEKFEMPAQWEHSPAEVAARYFPIGSWNWLQMEKELRVKYERIIA